MRIGTVNIGDVLCPDGTDAPTLSECFGGSSGFDPVNNPEVPVEPGQLGCPFGFTEVNGECLPIPQTTIPGGYNPQPVVTPISIPIPTLPTPQSACPSGFTMTSAGCLPNSSPVVQQQQAASASSTIIHGVPDWMVYGIGALAALTLFGSMGGRRR